MTTRYPSARPSARAFTRPFTRPFAHPVALAALAAALAACSSVPDRNQALEQVRAQHASVRSDATVTQHAAEELERADRALRAAEAAQADDAGRPEVDHLAYLAGQQLRVAQETATSRRAQAVTAGAAAERDRMRLAMRTQEADTAQRDLAASERTGARQSADLAQAERSAQDDRARLASRDARVDALESELAALNARRTERGIVVTLGDMLFASGQSQLQPEAARSIAQLAGFLQRQPQRRASIEGYTDSVGSDASNQSLSERRARSVMTALAGMGIGAERMQALGHGETSPVADNLSAEGRRMNRRVEVVFAAEAADILAQ